MTMTKKINLLLWATIVAVWLAVLICVPLAIGATAASAQSVNTTGGNVFDAATDGGPCTTFVVKVPSGSSYGVLVNIPGLHKAGEFYPIAVGEKEYFRLGANQIQTVFVKGNGGTATVSYGVIARVGS